MSDGPRPVGWRGVNERASAVGAGTTVERREAVPRARDTPHRPESVAATSPRCVAGHRRYVAVASHQRPGAERRVRAANR